MPRPRHSHAGWWWRWGFACKNLTSGFALGCVLSVAFERLMLQSQTYSMHKLSQVLQCLPLFWRKDEFREQQRKRIEETSRDALTPKLTASRSTLRSRWSTT
eukprot:1984921-Amphidinium_carterae.1